MSTEINDMESVAEDTEVLVEEAGVDELESQEAIPEEEDASPTLGELWELCGELGSSGDVLGRLASACSNNGYAGPTTALRLTYLAATTRLLDRPVSVALRGPASAGKSYTIKQALAFIPPEECVVLTAMSEKALVYLNESLEHKVLVVYEGAGISGEFLSYAVRSLLSEGRLEYAYTDFDRKKTVKVTKEGPTGLITSTAGAIDFELATRVIAPNIDDTPELTRAILRAEARTAQGHSTSIDYGPFHALQRYVAAGPRQVVVPYATTLADATDTKAVRLRRDFAAILVLVQGHALLHQHDRQRDSEDRLVAEPADYAAVHELVADMVAEASEATVPQTVRETVAAVWKLQTPPADSPNYDRRDVTIAKLSSELGIGRSSASRRVKRAMGLGFLADATTKKNGPKVIETAEPMPEDTGVLPHPDVLT